MAATRTQPKKKELVLEGKGGRPPTGKETADIRKPVLFTPSEDEELEEFFAREDVGEKRYGTFLHDLMLNVVRGKIPMRPVEIDWANVGTNSFRAPLLSRVPCGPLKEAVDNGDAFTVSADTADELETRDGDFWVRAEGESMLESGIQDGFLVLMRPLEGRPPKRGEIALLQFFDEEGAVYEATLKHWNGEGKYADAKGEAFEGPEGYEAKAVAVARGVMGRV